MASLKEIFERAQQTGQVEYTYFGGGTNVSPFNQTSIPVYPGTNKKLNSKSPYIRLGYEGGFPDDLKFREGDPTGVFNTGLAIVRDTARIGAFFTDVPNGPLWLIKQSGLQLSNPDTSYQSVNTDGSSTLLSKLTQIEGPRFYNPIGLNTLASVSGNALGLHFTRHGLSPTNDTGYISLNTVNTQNGAEFKSRLTEYKSKLLNNNPSQETLLNNYVGGPNSFYGIGRTRTFSYVNQQTTNYLSANNGDFVPFTLSDIDLYSNKVRKGENTVTISTPSSLINPFNSPLTNLITVETNGPGNGFIQDFRQVNDNKNAENYPELNVHDRVGVTTGQVAVGTPNTVDSINTISITPRSVFYGYSNSATNKTNSVPSNLLYSGLYDSAEVQSKTNGSFGRDIIKFRIELLNNDQPIFGGAVNTDVLAFRAYLDTLTDDMSPTWKPFNYMGRGEDFYVYEKFSRKINFSFVIFAHSKYEMPAIYTKLNYLMSAMAPDYNLYNQMRGTYAYLTIGDYIYQQPGVFTQMQISGLLDAPWEITLAEPEARPNINDYTDKYQHEVPKYMKVTMAFNPIHNFLPKKNHRDTAHTATFVTPNWRVGHNNYYLPQDLVTTPDGTQRSTLINIPEQDIKN
jgi:hypothetical protein